MITDYSRKYKNGPIGSKGKKGAGGPPSAGGWFWKLSGIVVVLATLTGLVGGFWFAWRIRNGLDDLAREMERKKELTRENAHLQSSANVLLARERVEKIAAAELDLYPTSKKALGTKISVRIPEP